MKSIAMQELKADPSKVLDRLAEEKVGFIVTRDGKPAAMLVYLDEDLLDHFIIANHPALMKELEEAVEEGKVKGGVDHETMKRMIERGR